MPRPIRSTGVNMATMITGERLLEAVKTQTFIKGGDERCAEGVKYDFRMGKRLLKAKFGRAIDMTSPQIDHNDLFVEPGEMVFVLTQERIELPQNMTALLSPKRKLSHQGIMVLGGFCIDPLYPGRLLVGLYNFSSTRFPLVPEKKLIAAVFYQLEGNELSDFPEPEAAVEDFPDELIHVMQSYKPAMLGALQDTLLATQRDVETLRAEFRSQEDWQKRFRESLDRHDNQIERILTGLNEEKTNRVEGQRDFENRLREMQKELYGQAAKLGAIIGGIVIVAGVVVQYLFSK